MICVQCLPTQSNVVTLVNELTYGQLHCLQELANQIVEPINQDTEDNSNPGISAAEAEADAISRGLQVICVLIMLL
jgi:hypothetical protein